MKVTRRELLSAGLGGLIVGSAGVVVGDGDAADDPTTPTETEPTTPTETATEAGTATETATESYPYWTKNFEITEFDANAVEQSSNIQVTLGLRNELDTARVWPGEIWVANQEQYDPNMLVPTPEVPANDTLVVEPYLSVSEGTYDLEIVGTDHRIEGLEVP